MMAEDPSVQPIPAQLMERLATREAQRKAAEQTSRRERRALDGGDACHLLLPPLDLFRPFQGSGVNEEFAAADENATERKLERLVPKARNTPAYFLENMSHAKAFLLGRITDAGTELTSNAAVSVAQKTKLLDDLLDQIERLQKWYTESSAHLKPFHIEQGHQEVDEIKTRFHAMRAAVLPKRKFAFASQNRSTKAASSPTKVASSSSSCPLKAPATSVPASSDTTALRYSLSNLQDRQDLRIGGADGDDLREESVYLSDLINCTVTLEATAGNLMVNRLSGCTVICQGGIATSALLHNCTDCAFTLACRQLRVHTSRNCRLDIFVVSAPIIEDCGALRVAPLSMADDDEAARLFGSSMAVKNHWDQVQDFSCPTTVAASTDETQKASSSANWTLLPENEWKRTSIGE